jgi:hypothetical protein
MNPELAEQSSLIRLLLREKFRVVVAHIADLVAHRPGFHLFGGIGLKQIRRWRGFAVCVQPAFVILRGDNHGHPVVDLGQPLVGSGGEDGKGLQRIVTGVAPTLP